MRTEPLVRLRDNPVGVALARRRMRPRQALPTFAVIGILGACAILSGTATMDAAAWHGIRTFLLVLMGAILYIGGTNQVAQAVAEDRRSRLLDFHRAAPTTAWTNAVGYMVGPAAREYVGAACLLPFIYATTLFAGESLVPITLGLIAILMSGWLYHASGMHAGLTSSRKKVSQGAAVAVVLLFMVGGGMLPGVGHLTPVPALVTLGVLDGSMVGGENLTFYGLPCSHFVLSLLLQGHLFAFLFWSSTRKLRCDGSHAFSRRGALSFFAIASFLWLGPFWAGLDTGARAAGGLCFFLAIGTGLAAALASSTVPRYLEFARTVRRAQRRGRTPNWHEDGATAWPLAPAFLGLVALGTILIVAGTQGGHVLGMGSLASPSVLVALASTAAVIAFVVGTVEFARLKLRKASRGGTFLVGFLTLVLPWILGSIALAGDMDPGTTMYVFALSPIFAALGSAVQVAAALGAAEGPDIAMSHVVFSLAVTALLAAWFHLRASQIRASLVNAGP